MSHSSSMSTGGVRPRLVRLALLTLAAFAAALPAAAVTHHVDVLLDLDNSAATGCTVATSEGPFDGVEQILRSVVETEALPAPSATVVEVVRLECVSGSLFDLPVTVDDGDWPVGIGLGDSGSDVIETYFPADALPANVDTVRLGVTIRTLGSGNEDALLVTEQGQPILISLANILEIPTLSEWGLLLMAALLALAAAWRLRRRAVVATLVAILVLGGAGVAWATTLLDGNPSDWQFGTKRAGTPPAACTGLRIASLYAKAENGQLCLRIDACLEFNEGPDARDDDFTTPEDTPLSGNVLVDNGHGADSDPDGDPLTVDTTPVTAPANGGVVLAANGDFTYTPDANFNGTDSFEYQITDGNGGSDVGLVTITVTAVNDAPVVDPAAFSVSEDATVGTVVGTVTFSDPDAGQGHTFAITAGNTGGAFAIDAATGVVTVAAALDFETLAAYSLTVEVTDDGAPVLSGSATVDVTVLDADDPPVAVDDAATVTEDDPPTTIDVLANDTDVDGGPKTVVSVTLPANGHAAVTNGGADVSYRPNPDYCNDPPGTSLDTFTYTLNGGSTATVTVTVTCEDDDPVAVDDAATVDEDSAASTIDVLANDSDVDGGPISIQSVTQPANGTVAITNAGADLTYQPDADYCNDGTPVDTFTYTLTPGGATATVSVTVTCVDDPPLAVDDDATVLEDSGANAIDVLANDTDTDGGPKSVQSVTQPANGTAAITGGGTGVSYTPNADYCNNPPGTRDTFTYTLNGGSVATVSVSVTCVDDAPTAVADAATVGEDSGANTINVLANDVDLDAGPISVIAVTQPANGVVAITNGGADLAYAPNADYCNTPPGTTPDTFTYTLNGGSVATVTVAVTCVNDGPVIDLDADDDKGTGGDDFAATFTEGDAATLIVDPDDPAGAVVTDVDSATLASLTVTITNLLDTGDETLSADVTGTSIVANYVPATGVLTLTGPDTLASFTQVLRTVRYHNGSLTPDETARVVHFVANDGATDGNTAVSTVTVVAVDTPPTAVDDAATVVEDSTANAIDVLANDTDPDGGPISVTSVTQPANGTVAITGGGTGVEYTPDAEYCNDGSPLDTFTYTLTPGGSTATVGVTVTCVDDAPTAVADAATVVEDSGANTIDVLANDTDPDGGPISVTSVTQPANGTAAITNGGADLTYTPNADYCNSPPGTTLDTFTYTLTPGGSSTTVTVTVTCVDDDPVAVADAATVVEDSGANAIDVLANDTDVDGGAISIDSVTQPANGSVGITGGGTGVTYTPNADYCNDGSPLDTFTYTLTPGGSTATVSVTVTCVDDPPTAVADAATVDEDSGANTIDVQANDTDVDGGTNTISAVTQPANGTVAITNGGADLTYAPNANYCNDPPGTTLDTFTYTLSPGGSSTSVTVTVNCINDPPVAGADSFDFIGNTELRVDVGAAATPHALETTGTGFGVLDNDADPVEGDAIAVTSITVGACTDSTGPTFDCSDPAVGTVHMNADGSFSFEPAAGDAGASESFTYTVTDNGVPAPASAVGTVTLTRHERVWYVDPTAGGGGDGTAASPLNNLNSLDGAGGAGDFDVAGDYVFVHDGTLALSAPMEMEAGQHLVGEGVGLSIPVNLNGNGSPTVLVAAGIRPQLTNATGDAVRATHAVPVEIVGLSLASGAGNAIDVTSTVALTGSATLTIANNQFRGATAEGIDVNLNGGTTGTLALAVTGNTWDLAGTHAGNAVDVNRLAGTLHLAFNGNTNLVSNNVAGAAVVVNGGGVASTTITGFSGNTVHQNTLGGGVSISNVTFDANTGSGGFQQVDGDNLAIGVSGDHVGTAGLTLSTVQGNLFFDDLDVYGGTSALTISGTGGGMTFAVTPASPDGSGTSVLRANNGAALDVTSATIDLRLDDLDSITTAAAVNLSSVAGTFRADGDASISKTSGGGTAFSVASSSATVTYAGTLNVTSGGGVSLTNNSGTMSFSGGMTLSTGANTGFNATGGGTVTVTDPVTGNNTITTTSGTALNVNGTTIGAAGLTFESISAGTSGTPVNGIALNNTGALGGLTVTGNGGGSNDGSGGTIQNTTGAGIVLTDTRNVSLGQMNITNPGTDGITINNINGFTLNRSNIVDSAGTAPADKGIDVGNFSTGTAVNGTINITNSVIGPAAGNAPHDSLAVGIGSGTSTWNVTGTTFRRTGNSGINLELRGTANVSAFNVTNNTFSGAGSATSARGVFANTLDDSVLTLTIQNNTFTNNNIHVDLNQQNDTDPVGSHTFTLANNTTMTGANSHAVNIFAAAGSFGGTFTGTISGNVIGNSAVAGSGSAIGNGLRVNINGGSDATMLINGNNIRQTPNGRGIEIIGRNGTGGLDVTVTNNDVNPQAPSDPLAAILVQSNCLTTCNTVRSDVRGNTVPAGTNVTDLSNTYLQLVESSTSTLELVDTTAPISGTCATELAATNTGSTSVLGGCALIAGPISTP